MMYYKPTPLFRADIRKIAHGLIYNTYYTVLHFSSSRPGTVSPGDPELISARKVNEEFTIREEFAQEASMPMEVSTVSHGECMGAHVTVCMCT